MDHMNIFDPQAAYWTKATTTAAVNREPYVPDGVSNLLDWETKGETTDKLVIEFQDGAMSMIPEAPRGAPGDEPDPDERSAVPIIVPHFPQRATLLADSLRGVRAFGSELEETADAKTADIMRKFNRRNRLMWEVSRIGAITSKLYAYNRKTESVYVSKDWEKVLDYEKTVFDFDFSDATLDVRTRLNEAKELAEEHLGDFAVSHWILLSGKNRFNQLVDHPKVVKSYERWNDGAFLRDDNRDGWPISSDVTVVKYKNAKVNGIELFDPNAAILLPVAQGLYQTRFAPGTGFDSLGSIGLPEYVSPHYLPHNEGVEFKGQTNVVSWMERPEGAVHFRQP